MPVPSFRNTMLGCSPTDDVRTLRQVAGRHEQVLPTVEVEVVEGRCPRDREVVDALVRAFDPAVGLLDERSVALAAQQLVAADVRQRHVEVAVAIDVADADTHRVHVEPGA